MSEHVETTPDTSTADTIKDLEALDTGPDFEPEPGNDNPEPSRPTIPTKELIQPIVSMACVTLAPAWNIGQAEQEGLAEAYGAVLDKYFPEGIETGPEFTALVMTAGVILPRYGQPRHEEQEGGEDGKESEHQSPE